MIYTYYPQNTGSKSFQIAFSQRNNRLMAITALWRDLGPLSVQ